MASKSYWSSRKCTRDHCSVSILCCLLCALILQSLLLRAARNMRFFSLWVVLPEVGLIWCFCVPIAMLGMHIPDLALRMLITKLIQPKLIGCSFLVHPIMSMSRWELHLILLWPLTFRSSMVHHKFSHAGQGCALTRTISYETPLYDLNIDRPITDQLYSTGHFEWMDIQTDEDEHSIEMHLPYIAKVMSRYSTFCQILAPIHNRDNSR